MKENKSNTKPLIFFLLVYALSAPLWLIQLFITQTNLPLNIPITNIVAAFTPMGAACILTYKEKGKVGLQNFLLRIFDFKKVSVKWWIVIALIAVIIFVLIYILLIIFHYPIPLDWNINYFSIPFLLLFFYLGSIGEEVGYTGYAIEPLLQRYNAVIASILIGIPWVVWHYPSMFQQGRNVEFFLWGSLGTIAFRVIFVWLFTNTNKSLSAPIILHALYNTGRVFFPTNNQNNPLVDYPIIHYSIIIIIAIMVTLLWDYKTLSKFKFQKIITNVKN